MVTLNVLTTTQSLSFIMRHHASVARFGDGEIDLIAGASIPYQDYDPTLAARLRTLLETPSTPQLLICMPDVFHDTERYNQFAQDFWQAHVTHYEKLYQEIQWAPVYGSTFISRPYIDLLDKTPATAAFRQLKQLWAHRDVLLVEGATSRSGVGNDLFADAQTITRIICPAKNAYAKLEVIEAAIRTYGQDKLVIVMLGPTAKLIAADLSQIGMQIIDLGHIDSEYEWYQMGATTKVKLPHKHTAEFNYDTDITYETNQDYDNQIIKRIQ
ncbi:SP_1767 family glycosyltransferase [Leuconostoc holzapfelii]|uniref:SP_1767 family glycosyltransferase n=1 Tax=Leuconostoc holzapfelii TaxID=434464 RepID=A0ABT2NYE7_9LACO|nr:SP_1767 family glycosyltransferase [Leuconostoc holzapfelii]MCT8389091.1 SP_1767 family glycosyltransferase [Leuconostoc holzapfelii]